MTHLHAYLGDPTQGEAAQITHPSMPPILGAFYQMLQTLKTRSQQVREAKANIESVA